jgi:hypothetical protein
MKLLDYENSYESIKMRFRDDSILSLMKGKRSQDIFCTNVIILVFS